MKRKVGERWGREGAQITENRFLIPQVWGGAREFAFLTNSQGIWTLRVLGRGTSIAVVIFRPSCTTDSPGKLKILAGPT